MVNNFIKKFHPEYEDEGDLNKTRETLREIIRDYKKLTADIKRIRNSEKELKLLTEITDETHEKFERFVHEIFPHNEFSFDSDIKEVLDKMLSSKSIAFDTETTGLDQNTAELVGLCLSSKKGEG